MKFAVISDTHFYARVDKDDKIVWNLPLSTLSREIGEAMVSAVNSHCPDFVVHCGDFTGLCDIENFDFGVQIMDMLDCPWYVIPGNHDTWYNHDAGYDGLRGKFSALYDLPDGICHYSKIIKGILFLFVDNSYWIQENGDYSGYLYKDIYDSGQILGQYLPPFEMEWMKQEIEKYPDLPAIFVCHNPPAIKSNLSLNSRNAVFFNRYEMMGFLSGFNSIKAVFCVHCHINDYIEKNGIAICQTCSMREFPFEYRIAEIKDGKMEVKTFGLDDKSFEKRSFIPERNNFWVKGRHSDREFTVNMDRRV
jgi:3',5'-cyclic AMP phosphodiesterase CpdA